jgi:hypothetical protein
MILLYLQLKLVGRLTFLRRISQYLCNGIAGLGGDYDFEIFGFLLPVLSS